MNFSKAQIAIVGIVLLVIIFLVLLFTGVIPGLRDFTVRDVKEVTLWGVFDTEDAINSTLITDFKATNPAVEVVYERKDSRTYEEDLIDALAAGVGPDVFMFKNTWLLKHADKLAPITFETMPLPTLRNLYPSVVETDFVLNEKIYALPLYMDTLSLFFNKDFFDQKGIAEPPKTWEEFFDIIVDLREFDRFGRLTKAAAAIGGSEENINQAVDLLYLIMLQDGVKMLNNSGTRAAFSRAGINSMAFYTSFASLRNLDGYTWDPTFSYSIDGFSEGDIGMIFNYGYQAFLLREKNPFLNFGIAPMFQPEGAVEDINYADYWGLAVSKSSKNPEAAWQFILGTTTNPDTSIKYLNATQRLPVLRPLIDAIIDDPELGIFAKQALTAKSWPQADPTEIDRIFSSAIDLVISGRASAKQATEQAEAEVSATIARRLQKLEAAQPEE